MLHDYKEEGYTVNELYEKLLLAKNEGMGDRTVYIGPTGGKEGNESIALPVIGIEGNTDEDSSELDDWLLVQRESLHQRVQEAYSYLANYYELQGNYARAEETLRRAIRKHPEEAWGL